MKRIVTIFLWLSVCSTLLAHSYMPNSVLAEGKWVKIRVTESGVYCMTYKEIADAGLNPSELRIYGYGGAMLPQSFKISKIDDLPSVPFYMHKGADGVFNEGDYILFYAQGVDKWEYTDSHFVHTRNPYSRYGYYFLSDNAGVQSLIEEAPALTTSSYTANTYTDYMLHEIDSVNLVDVSGMAGGGREFYGENFTSNRSSLSFSFPFENVVPGSSLDVCCKLAAAAYEVSTFRVGVGAENRSFSMVALRTSDFYTKATLNEGDDRMSFHAVGTGEQAVNITYSSTMSASRGYLNYIEVAATCDLVMRGQSMRVNNVEHFGSAANTLYTMSGADGNIQIWDISTPSAVERIPATLSGSTLSWVGKNDALQTVLAIDPTRSTGWLKPVVIGTVTNQNIHALNDVDMVIICPEQFVDAAQIIANAHEEYDAIVTAIVTDEAVYNEFSSGTPDATAYRWIMKMLYDRASSYTKRPKWLLLLGDGTYDNRKLLPNSGQNTLLTYQAYNSEVETKAYATDDYFGFLDDTEGAVDISGRMDIAVGRLPVNTVQEALGVARKIETYMRNENPGKWRQQLVFLADDGDGNTHTEVADVAAELVRLRNEAFVVNKIYIDAFAQEVNASGESYPLAKNKFLNMLNDGVLFLDYSGHGGYNNITSENLLSLRDCSLMTNANQGFWMLATCGFAHFDAYAPSASEEAVINPNGGAIAVMSACRTVYASQNKTLNKFVCDTLFGHVDDFSYKMSIGEACRAAKNRMGYDDNKMSFVLLGDPAIHLHYPTDYRVQTEEAADTLNALTIHTFTGWIESENGDTAREFNGMVNISVYDKMQQITTNDNDEPDESKKVLFTYNDYPNVLYQGTARVQNGHFEYTFMLPKDIRYNYGSGRITYYALDSINGEGVGHFEDFIIGGSSPVQIVDTLGPDVHIYLNNPFFTSGDRTNESPHFYADIYDEHGINTSGSGIGHDLLLTMDSDPNMMYALNEYFTSDGGYQSGTVSYRLPELEEGQHSLTFRAWDMLNNSTTEAITFEVVKGIDPTMYSVITYPNPLRVNEVAHFRIEYDQPDAMVEMSAYVYTPDGALVYQTTHKGADQRMIEIHDASLAPGIYIYRICLSTTAGKMVSKAGKLVVVE